MTVLGQFVGFAGRSVASVVGGSGTATDPWKFEYQANDGSCEMLEADDASGFYYEYVPILAAGVPPGFNPAGGDLVSFRPCEAKFQNFPPPYTEGVHISNWLLFGWVTFTLHYAGSTYPDTTPYAILVDPEDANCYVLAALTELVKLQ